MGEELEAMNRGSSCRACTQGEGEGPSLERTEVKGEFGKMCNVAMCQHAVGNCLVERTEVMPCR